MFSHALTVALLVLPSFSNADPLHIPLTRRASVRSISDYQRIADNIRQKYGYASVNPQSTRKRASTAAIPVTNQDDDASFFGGISVGTPPQQFNVILDTGSADLWLAVAPCQGCSRGIPLFQNTQSSSFQPSSASQRPVEIQYGSGAVSGQEITETVSMGGFTVTGQTMLAVDQMQQAPIDGTVSGIMGLGFDTIAATQSTPFWQTLASGNQLSSPEFAFFLERDPNSSDGQGSVAPGGTMTLGGTNSSLFSGEIEFISLTGTPSFWLLTMSAITVQGKPITISTGDAAASAIDTGTTLLGGPTADVQAFYAAIPGSGPSRNAGPGFFNFPCNTQVQATFSLGGKAWPINPEDINIGPDAGENCLGAIFDLNAGTSLQAGQGTPSWVVGDTFLKNVYSVFRMTPPSVGFAQLSDLAGGSGTAPASSSTRTSLLTAPTPSSPTVPHSSSTVVVFSTVTGAPSAATGSTNGNSSGSGSGSLPGSTSGASTTVASLIITLGFTTIVLCLL